jgi:hypothetical protein
MVDAVGIEPTSCCVPLQAFTTIKPFRTRTGECQAKPTICRVAPTSQKVLAKTKSIQSQTW